MLFVCLAVGARVPAADVGSGAAAGAADAEGEHHPAAIGRSGLFLQGPRARGRHSSSSSSSRRRPLRFQERLGPKAMKVVQLYICVYYNLQSAAQFILYLHKEQTKEKADWGRRRQHLGSGYFGVECCWSILSFTLYIYIYIFCPVCQRC